MVNLETNSVGARSRVLRKLRSGRKASRQVLVAWAVNYSKVATDSPNLRTAGHSTAGRPGPDAFPGAERDGLEGEDFIVYREICRGRVDILVPGVSRPGAVKKLGLYASTSVISTTPDSLMVSFE